MEQDSLDEASSITASMLALDADDERFVQAATLWEVVWQSKEQFGQATIDLDEGRLREAMAGFADVSEQDTARFDLARTRWQEAYRLLEDSVVSEAEALLATDPRQAFWTIENALDVLAGSSAAQAMRELAAMETIASVDAQLRELTDRGDWLRAARLFDLTSEALLEFGPQFQERTLWFAEQLQQQQARALERVYSWTGGADQSTRYFDADAVRYTRSGENIVWTASDALEIHLYQNDDGLSAYLKVMVYHPNWVLADHVTATIDGETWDMGFSPESIERYEGARNAWEGAWREIVPSDIDPLMDLALSDPSTITFIGPDDESSFAPNAADKSGLQTMLLAYFALGGEPRSWW